MEDESSNIIGAITSFFFFFSENEIVKGQLKPKVAGACSIAVPVGLHQQGLHVHNHRIVEPVIKEHHTKLLL